MKIKEVPAGFKITCCGNTAQILKHGAMGTRNEQGATTDSVSTQTGRIVPLTLFGGNIA